MFLIRILIIAFIIGYVVWFVNNRILGKNLALARVIAMTLVITSVVYLLLGSLSYLIEGF
ncbi:MAG: hypothetical protein HN828_00215 [Candidatus Thioglobus sp.]|jgi:hypothetical protein|uniref:hypothetical protein n=1 Tax=Candidatus Thioglobus sp. TaxID=2026721 RepID=UPI001EC7DD63|nr:hypothetical protein [Candidatus Thioglobus sp.]MBT3187070.1 hypothetical protein [Candidatus Thioglobus sp.]MBT3431654.1 hypothetical protein [Candidatus Thioglobus sp.]MBT4923074.1 hypothetical protein [Candidatus Thioglobus sp.]MBT5286818.1 hypothetical protein [Candidatus Thioglobus sp.]MBT5784457.1 hypothetical protein [Candidatus Thioglobus sp.]